MIKQKLQLKFNEWNNIFNYCPNCGSNKQKHINVDYINNIECEYDIVCRECNTFLNYYSYGSYEYPMTRIEMYGYKYHVDKEIKYYIPFTILKVINILLNNNRIKK